MELALCLSNTEHGLRAHLTTGRMLGVVAAVHEHSCLSRPVDFLSAVQPQHGVELALRPATLSAAASPSAAALQAFSSLPGRTCNLADFWSVLILRSNTLPSRARSNPLSWPRGLERKRPPGVEGPPEAYVVLVAVLPYARH